MSTPDYRSFFEDFASAYQNALSGGSGEDLHRFFAENFMALGSNATLRLTNLNTDFDDYLEHSAKLYARATPIALTVTRVEFEELFAEHDRVKVHFEASYDSPDGKPLTLAFEVVYLLQRRTNGPKIFAFITGHDIADHPEFGLVNPEIITPA